MTLVSIDVPAARDGAGKITALRGTGLSEQINVNTAAYEANETAPPSFAALSGLWTELEEAADGLNARVDLAIIVNGGDEGALNGGPVSFEVYDDNIYAVKGELGKQLAEYAAGITGEEDGDQERLEQWQDMAGRWIDDDGVMTRMYVELGPDGAIDLTAVAGDLGFQREDGNLPIANMIRDGLETASQAWSPATASAYGREMVEHAANMEGDYPEDGDYRGSGQSLALSFLMYQSSMSGDLLSGVASGIDTVERTNDLPQGFWQMRSQTAFSGLVRGFDEADLESYWDPMASTFGALADHPEEALDWWSEDPGRQQYWISERSWYHDDFRNLAEVLNSASTDRALIDPPLGEDGQPTQDALNAANLASATVTYLAENGTFGAYDSGGFLGIGGSSGFGGIGAGEDLAHIISTYMPSVDASLDRGWEDAPGIFFSEREGSVLMPQFERGALEEMVRVASSSDEGFAELREGVSSYDNLVLSQAAAGAIPPDHEGPVTGALTSVAELEGFFAYNVGQANIAEGQSEDARNQAWIDLGSNLVGAVPVPGGNAVGFLADQSVSLTTDAVGDALTGNGERERVGANDMAQHVRDEMYLQAVQVLSESGALPSQQPGATPLPDSPGVVDGRALTADQIADLPPEEQRAAREDLVSLAVDPGNDLNGIPPQGLGAYVNQELLELAYGGAFDEYFPP